MKNLLFFLLFTFSFFHVSAQKKPTLTQRVEALEKAASKRSSVTTDKLYAQYKIDQEEKKVLVAKVDSLLLLIQQRNTLRADKIYVFANRIDTLKNK